MHTYTCTYAHTHRAIFQLEFCFLYLQTQFAYFLGVISSNSPLPSVLSLLPCHSTHTCMCMHTHMHAHTKICLHTHTHEHMHTYTHAYVQAH